ncbi:uncharacterized protein LOC109725957 [Ananas comosus]|uniref:Uncharacterized protein LOC109725957 n=1 Tax=Ananas comosus TaxID=4615 RepID=A0A6P5GYZ2_ANACO|nr:uncharacterized protein LOC109725957 [Ananas comosus]
MGNCQVAEVAAAAVVELPGGRVRRLYWPTPAAELMRSNPGHYVALVVVAAATAANSDRLCSPDDSGGAKATRVKLLKPKDMLLLGHSYKLITSQEVTKALRARKQEKMKKSQLSESIQKQNGGKDDDDEAHVDHVVDKGRKQVDSQSNNGKVEKHERERHKSRSSQSQSQANKARQWRPSLQSITEVGS